MKKISLLVAAFALLLTACGGSGDATMNPTADAYLVQVTRIVATSSDSTEPEDISAIVATMPDDTEPVTVN